MFNHNQQKYGDIFTSLLIILIEPPPKKFHRGLSGRRLTENLAPERAESQGHSTFLKRHTKAPRALLRVADIPPPRSSTMTNTYIKPKKKYKALCCWADNDTAKPVKMHDWRGVKSNQGYRSGKYCQQKISKYSFSSWQTNDLQIFHLICNNMVWLDGQGVLFIYADLTRLSKDTYTQQHKQQTWFYCQFVCRLRRGLMGKMYADSQLL